MNIAVSACLLGQKVRYDGGHKHDRFITDELGRYATFIPFCPEATAFGTPRSSIRLALRDDNVFVLSNEDNSDLTRQLLDKVYEEMHKIAGVNLSGITFKSKSPSCALGSAKIYFLLQAKDEKLCRVLGNIVANHEKLSFDELFKNYEYNFKVAISKRFGSSPINL
ncbi:MAG: DUF523 and DUF1722 domain-containing protein [Sulfurimonas sp.]|uniref:DUF523 and DUF1722 domain-containing protein n=1 Tax=Sulfurimonas sp. TaxID=2022749 RepID=UPI0026023B45|nr:DUF523 and DUF1722 domain-containing protein [Sulfurimonas sp.]MDD2653335.1 DUF523 and DUF1722 domain-containing protein [Sulfurimonas sp.]MDD3450783.1 DUF523 and DUF1722 domain-containing protein [Sulfurimonas sp.]